MGEIDALTRTRRRRFVMDEFYSQHHARVAEGAFKILDALQGTAEYMVASTAALFLLACERFQVEPRDAMTAAARMLRDARLQDGGGHYDAIRRTLEEGEMFTGGFR